jgi:hypothetical protein
MLTGPLRLTSSERRIRREAHSAARRELAFKLHLEGRTLAEIGQLLGCCASRVHQMLRKARRLTLRPHWSDPLPMRAQTFLHNMNFAPLSEVEAATAIARLSRRELLLAPNVGRGAVDAIAAWLASHGLELRPPPTKAGAPAMERPDDDEEAGPLQRAAETRCPYPTTES